jgi:uncharacterized protein with FMN-binding domain
MDRATFLLLSTYIYYARCMKKFFLSFFVVAASAGYVVYQYIGGATVSAATPPIASTQQTQTVTPAPAPTPAPPPTPTPAPAPKPTGQYIDGTYTGSTADAYYGYVQVQATVSGGKLTAVKFLQYPNDRGTSVYINQQAMPLLQQEAIQVQSANVSGVSGATDTSMAFRESLGAALSKAKNG